MHDPQPANGVAPHVHPAPSADQLGPQIQLALAKVNDPEIRRPITELKMVESVDVDLSGAARIRILLTVSGCPMRDTLTRDVSAAALTVPGVQRVEGDFCGMSDEQRG